MMEAQQGAPTAVLEDAPASSEQSSPAPPQPEPEPEPEPAASVEPAMPGSGHPYVRFVKEARLFGENPALYGANMFASTRRPQNALSGVASGAKTFFKCAGLGAAAAVSTPFVATYTAASTGLKEGLGVWGAGFGAAVGLATTAVAVPVVQIGRGIANTPDAIGGAMDDEKVWNEDAREWVERPPELLTLESLEDLQALLASESTSARTRQRGAVKETELYDLLSVEPDADAAAIKKAYRRTALKLHPDKNADDPSATEKFQAVGKAYQILSDERLRAAYDAGGAEATDENQLIDSTQLYELFFGSEQLEPAVGELLLLKCAGTVLEMSSGGDIEAVQEKLGGDELENG